MARVRQARSSRVDRLHRTLDVPQADRLGNVRQLAAAIRDGIDHAATLLELSTSTTGTSCIIARPR